MQRVVRIAALGAAGWCAAGGVAWAQNAITVQAPTAYATIHAAGITVTFSGDADADARAHVEYRAAGAQAFRRGPDMQRLANGRFTTSLIRLPAGTDHGFRMVVQDADNGMDVVVAGTFTTRGTAPPSAGPDHLYVDAATGNDGAAGTAAAPFRTIQHAVQQAGPGTTVHVLPGVYREHVQPPSGSAAAPLRVVAEGDGVVMDGADALLASGTAAWVEEGGGVWSAPFLGASRYAEADGARLYDYASLQDLRDGHGNVGMPGVIPAGFFVDETAGRVFVKLPGGASPLGRAVHVASLPSAFLLDGVQNVVVEGFEIRHYGSVEYSGVGVDVRDASRCWVRRNRFHHLNTAVRIRRSNAHENVVEHNTFRDTGVYGWPWASAKAHTPEASAVEVTHGHGNVVRWNVVEGSFNGIYVGAFGDSNEEIGRDTDVYENRLSFHGDDGMEFEGAVLRVRAWENHLSEVYNAISLAPVEQGPLLLVRNVVDGYQRHAFKVNNGPTGHMLVFHTTALPLPAERFPDAQVMAPTEPFGGLLLRNNVLQANRYAIEHGGTQLLGPVDLDHDLLHTLDVGGAGRFVKWLNVRYADMAALASSGTVEAHGLGDAPAFEDRAAGNLALAAGHSALDRAQVLPGINDTDVVGAGPDPGAFERGGIVPGPDDPASLPDGGVVVGPSSSAPASSGMPTSASASGTSHAAPSSAGSPTSQGDPSGPGTSSSSTAAPHADGGGVAEDAGAGNGNPPPPGRCACSGTRTADTDAAGWVLPGALGWVARRRGRGRKAP